MWPDQLINDLARRRSILVLGSGVSKQATNASGNRPPLWAEFLKTACTRCPKKDSVHEIERAIDSGDFLHACEWLKEDFREDWIPFLRQTFKTPQYLPSDLHRIILRLDSRVIFDLNFDDLITRAASEEYQGTEIVKRYYDDDVEEFLRANDERFIIKVHGSLDVANNIIFTQREYAEARTKFNRFYAAFDAALLSHSFLFIGSGTSDPDLKLLLENQNFSFPAQKPHYFLTSKGISQKLQSSLKNSQNLRVLVYDPVDEGHSGLRDQISELVELVEERRIDIAQTLEW